MLVYLNGRIIPEDEARISPFDRGYLYGDGLFESIRIYGGKPFLWRSHMERFLRGSKLLQIAVPLSDDELRTSSEELISSNQVQDAMLRIHLSRGEGTRGYSPRKADKPTLLISTHPLNPSIQSLAAGKAIISRFRLFSEDPLAGVKHSNKLLQVLARAEADAAFAEEALMENERGHIVEGTSSNFFWIGNGSLCTSPIREGILPGTTRAYIMELGRKLGLKVNEGSLNRDQLGTCEGAFLSSAGLEILELTEINGQNLNRSEITRWLYIAYQEGIHSSLATKELS